jgi:3-oxoadipate enol-lactonase
VPKPGPDAERRVRVADVDLAVRDSASGRPFVWGHGLLSSMAQEDETGMFGWQGLTDATRVVRYDARGHGSSGATTDPDGYTWPSLAGDMLGLLDAVDIDRAVLGGASMGCATAIYAALKAPERVERLVLAIPPTAWATRAAQQRLYKGGAAAVTVTGLHVLVATMRARPAARVPAERYPGSRDKSLEHLLRSDRTTVSRILRGAGRSDLPSPEDLATLRMPTLVLAWEGDPVHPVETARKLADVMPDVTLHVARAGRDLDGWASTVRTFLSA